MKVGDAFTQMIVATLLAFPSTAFSEEEQIILQPTSIWNVTKEENSCLLVRQFGAPGQKTLLSIRQPTLDDWLDLSIAGKAIERVEWNKVVQLDYGIEPPVTIKDPRSAMNSVYGPAMILRARIGTEAIEDHASNPEQVVDHQQDVEQIGILNPGINLLLKTGKMARPLQALRKCVDDMFLGWGVEPSRLRMLSQPPKMKSPMAFAKALYGSHPPETTSKSKSEKVTFLVVLDAQGVVTHCKVIQTTDQRFNDWACNGASAAAFEPARDENGTAVPWYYVSAAIYNRD